MLFEAIWWSGLSLHEIKVTFVDEMSPPGRAPGRQPLCEDAKRGLRVPFAPQVQAGCVALALGIATAVREAPLSHKALQPVKGWLIVRPYFELEGAFI